MTPISTPSAPLFPRDPLPLLLALLRPGSASAQASSGQLILGSSLLTHAMRHTTTPRQKMSTFNRGPKTVPTWTAGPKIGTPQPSSREPLSLSGLQNVYAQRPCLRRIGTPHQYGYG
jgi:hypothetical protein